MSVQDFIRTAAPPPDWLEKAWSGAKRRGLDTLTPADIDAEIIAHRRKTGPCHPRRGEVIRAVIDTNVLVSGLLSPSGNEASICSPSIRAWFTRFSEDILDEYAAVLARPKFGFPLGRDRGGASHVPQSRVSSFSRTSRAVSSDPADTKFLHCAHTAQADYIVTGNKRDFPDAPLWRDARLECRRTAGSDYIRDLSIRLTARTVKAAPQREAVTILRSKLKN